MHRIADMRICSRLLAGLVALLAAMLSVMPAHAASGYWRFTGYTVDPPQSQLDESDRLERQSGRTSERRISGAVQGGASSEGTVELFFKNDNVDHQVFLTTLVFNFSTSSPLANLTPGSTVRVRGSLSMGGNGLSKALPARGNGTVAVDNGDNLLSIDTAIDQPASGQGEFTVPNGGPGATISIHVGGYIGSNGALRATMHVNYQWVAGQAPAGGSAAASSPSGGRPAGNSAGGGSSYGRPTGNLGGNGTPWGRPAGNPPAIEPPHGPAVQLFNNNNSGGVENGAQPTWITFSRTTRITTLQTYHWNYGRGSGYPGQIGLVSASGQSYGPWQATGQPGQGGVPNAFWTVNPNVVLPAGRYRVTDSSPQTWSQNGGTSGQGFVIVLGN